MNHHKQVWDLACRISNYVGTEETFNHPEEGRIEVRAELLQQLWWAVRCGQDSTKSGRKGPWSYEEAMIFDVMES
jgi:hypothetical protein